MIGENRKKCRGNLGLMFMMMFFCPQFSANVFAESVLEEDVALMSKSVLEKVGQHDRVAVMDFKNLDGQINYFGKYLAGTVGTRLANAGVRVIERDELERIFEEQKIQMSGAFDSQTLTKIGQLTGASSVLVGTITDFDEKVDVSLKLLDVEKGENKGGGSSAIKKTRAIRKLIDTITKAEREKEIAIEMERERIVRSVENEKNARIAAFQNREKEMKNKLNNLDSELAAKSKIYQEYKEKEKQLDELEIRSSRIMAQVADLSEKVKRLVRCRMTKEEVVSLVGSGRARIYYENSWDRKVDYGYVAIVYEDNLVKGFVKSGTSYSSPNCDPQSVPFVPDPY